MDAAEIADILTEGTILEGPHWTEPVKVLTAKNRGKRIEVQAVGTLTKKLWTKLLNPEEFGGTVKVTGAGKLAALDGNPTHFRLAAEAHRIRLAFQYDPHFAVSVSQVDPLPHQMDAVYTHLLTQPRIRFLIADDPGAGKTIMAGVTIKELKFRGLAMRILIITPANLTDQWRRELHEKFGETFTVINRGTVSASYGRNVWEDSPQCIASVDFVARQDDILNMIRDVHWDLVIVDEAHKMAAYRYGNKVNKTQRYELGEFLRDHTDHFLFLTATPHKGDPDHFALLLQLLDQDLYVTLVCRKRIGSAGLGLWDDVRQELKPVAQERLDFFWSQGIRGADFFISAIGSSLSVFGKYERVTKLSGEAVTVGQFLDEVRGLVTNYALAKILKTAHTGTIDPESRFYVVWKWSYADAKVPADESFKLAQALGLDTERLWDRTGVLEKSGENVQATPVAKRSKVKNLGEPSADGAPASLIDVLHRMCAFREKGDTDGMAEFLGRSGHANNHSLWLVAQAISEILPDGDKEKQLMQGLLNQKEGLEEAARQKRLF
jgi:hypothetical protein